MGLGQYGSVNFVFNRLKPTTSPVVKDRVPNLSKHKHVTSVCNYEVHRVHWYALRGKICHAQHNTGLPDVFSFKSKHVWGMTS